jgi:hypothetical protein
MRYWAMGVAGVCLLAMSAGINPASAAVSLIASQTPIVLAQAETKKPETVTQKVKRTWRKLTGYKFAVGCPALIPLSHSTCTETGKNREAARAKCQSQNVLCSVSDAK